MLRLKVINDSNSNRKVVLAEFFEVRCTYISKIGH